MRTADIRAGLGAHQLDGGRTREGAGLGTCHDPVVPHARDPATTVMSAEPPVVAVLGLGEAGSAIAADLAAAGAVVRGFDPRVRPGPGVTACAGDADACRGAAVVVSLTCAHEAEEALTTALPGIGPGAVYADLNTASAEAKVHLAGLAE